MSEALRHLPPRHLSGYLVRLLRHRPPVQLVNGRLIGAFDDHLVDAHMRRTAGDPHESFGDVLGGQCLDAFIDFLRARFFPE